MCVCVCVCVCVRVCVCVCVITYSALTIDIHTHTQYKYQLNLDGTVAAYRLPYLLAGGSLVLKQDSDYYEHFYRHLQPWVHYVPLERDVSDVVERLEWALENDDQVRPFAPSPRSLYADLSCGYVGTIQLCGVHQELGVGHADTIC